MTLEELTATIKEQEQIASVNPDDMPFNVRPGWASRVAVAREEVTKLKKDHKSLVVKNVLTIFPVGTTESVDKFVQSAKEVSGAFVLNVNDYYKTISDVVWSVNSSQTPATFTFTQVAVANSKFVESVIKLGTNVYNKLNFDEMPHLNNEQETLEYVKRVIRQANQDEFNVTHMINVLSDQVYAASFTKTTVPVVIVGATTEEATSIANRLKLLGAQPQRVDNVFTLTDELDTETIMKMLGTVKKKVSKKEVTQTKEN